jgi:pimeloyl-ACP methyl ester carboxylesterase
VITALATAACTHDSPSSSSPSPASRSTADASSSAPSGAAVPAIAFADCSSQFRTAVASARANQMDFGCGKLTVPLDYAKPKGATIQLFVVKIHYQPQSADERIGSLLVNPGGPGGSGVDLAASLVNELSLDVFSHFDVIGFDPRGVGLSAPVQCISNSQKDSYAAQDPNVATAAGRVAAKAASAALVKGCVAKYGSTLGHFNTEETARDMDLIRQAVGDRQLNYLGYSYGTRLGAAYAHLFPKTIRAAVLDGAVDPTASVVTDDEQQAAAFEKAFDQFAADCRSRPACAVLGDPRAFVEHLIPSADAQPLSSSAPGETRKATGGIVVTAVASALYDQSQWDALGAALVAAKAGDAAKLFALSDAYNGRDATTGNYTNLQDANLAINCNDSTFQVTDAVVAAEAARWRSEYPIFGLNAAASLYSCVGWPPSGHPLPPASAPGAPPILVVGTVHDPATPFASTAVLAKALGSGVVLSWDGEGHTAYPKTPCVTTKVNDYLISDQVPTGDSCPAG